MNIEIWSLGKANEDYIEKGIQHYFKRLRPHIKVDLQLIPPPKRSSNMSPEQSMQLEEKAILSRLNEQKHYLILLDETGTLLKSEQWAETFNQLQNQSVQTLVFLIGGPWGVTQTIKAKAKKTWSLSKLVFPHQIVRLIIAEQIYRAYSILNHTGYHHV